MTIDKCNKCKYLTNKPIGFGGTITWCKKNNDVIRVSLKDYKTLISECPKENAGNK